MNRHFRTDVELGLYWQHMFHKEECMQAEVHLVCEDTLHFTLLCLSFENDKLHAYARDALHFALVAEFRDHAFWDFLLNDTFNMQHLFGLDQSDLIIMVMLILEFLNNQGIYLPKICYELAGARCGEVQMTEVTARFFRFADFAPFDFELSPLLSPPDDNESNKVLVP